MLITGHTGFKGAWLSYWLYLLGAKVSGIALEPNSNSLFNKLHLKDKIDSNIADIRDSNLINNIIQDYEPDILFHLAGQALVKKSYENPKNTFETNVIGSLNVLEAVNSCNSIGSLVYITSDKCYLNNEWEWGYRETDPLGGIDPYSASKACAEHVFKSYAVSFLNKKKRFGAAAVRAGNVIGGGDYSENRIIPDIFKSIENRKAIIIRSPNATRPWQHILDPLSGYLLIGKKLFNNSNVFYGESWNIGPNNDSIKTVLELTNFFLENWEPLNRPVVKLNDLGSNLHESNFLHLSIDKIQTKLKWHPTYNFHQAVKATGQWYKKVMDGQKPLEVTKEQILEFEKKINA